MATEHGQNGDDPAITLDGKRILVVEDEPTIAMMIEDMLIDFGCRVVGPALRIPEARALARCETLDGALLDVNMGEGPSFDIARILRERHVPFCFATGYGASGILPEFEARPVLQKPFSHDALRAFLLRCLVAPASP